MTVQVGLSLPNSCIAIPVFDAEILNLPVGDKDGQQGS